MLLTIPEILLQQIRVGHEQSGSIYGRLLDNGDVAQVTCLDASNGTLLGHWVIDQTLPETAENMHDGVLLIIVSSDEQELAAYRAEQGHWLPINHSVLRLYADYNARLKGLFESDVLADTCVAVIGLGSGGSMAAAQLARCGIGRMRLVDFDRLEVHNVVRHVCGISDVGRYKTFAVRDLLTNLSPLVDVQTWEIDVVVSDSLLAQIVTGCDLVIAATDSEASKLTINRACWERSIPVVYGATYNRAFGGDVFRAVPPNGACYECFHALVADFFADQPMAATDFSPGYADPSRMADLIAEPGLAMDIGMIALLVARMSLLTLLRGRASSLPDFPTDWILFGNRAEWIFQAPLESLFIDVPKRPDCAVCNYDAYVQYTLAMSAEEARQAAQHILADVSTFQSNASDDTSEEDR